MISEKMQRDINALRRQLAPFAHVLPPLAMPLLDSLEDRVDGVARLEDAAYLNLETLHPVQGNAYEQPQES